ncbi:MAG: hypothetical protein JSR80_02465 [Verrucomicrobia bacterium]|nr:hypothetical protein [Verrucomicrobiota bacterium]
MDIEVVRNHWSGIGEKNRVEHLTSYLQSIAPKIQEFEKKIQAQQKNQPYGASGANNKENCRKN